MNFTYDLQELLKEKTCIAGIGNSLMNDDGVGPYIIDELKNKITADNITFINTGDVLENYIFRIADSDFKNVIIIDAVDSAQSDKIIFTEMNSLYEINNNYSTHKLALSISAKILQQSGKNVYLLGIKSSDTGYGNNISRNVLESADRLIGIFEKSIMSSAGEHAYV